MLVTIVAKPLVGFMAHHGDLIGGKGSEQLLKWRLFDFGGFLTWRLLGATFIRRRSQPAPARWQLGTL